MLLGGLHVEILVMYDRFYYNLKTQNLLLEVS